MKTVLLIFTLVSMNAVAGHQTGKVSKLTVRASDGLIFFELSGGQPGNKPECAKYSYWMIKDENSTVGKQQYSLLLMAYASGKPVYVDGMGRCSRWGDGEDVNFIRVM